MSDRTPPKWFERQTPPSEKDPDWARRRQQLLEELPGRMERERNRDRAHSFYPYLLVRSILGDRGDRPTSACFWESPDIWIARGDSTVSPAIPPDHGGVVTVGRPQTLYAHVWNLGFAPLVGIFVEFYWFNPSLGITGANANLVGVARCELSGRGMPGSHKLVKCPKPWVPVSENGGHECLVVRVSGIGDPVGANEWMPWLNRHVAQRNISVVALGANISRLVSALDATRPFNTTVQLVQLGSREAELVRRVAAPRLRLANLDTRVLGELSIVNELAPAKPDTISGDLRGVLRPFAGERLVPERRFRELRPVRIIDPSAILRADQSTGALAGLLTGSRALHPDAESLAQPAADEAQVVRLATYSGDQLVGGYTVVVKGL